MFLAALFVMNMGMIKNMIRIIMTIELEYDDMLMHGRKLMAQKLWIDDILMSADGGLTLHSELVGDEIGKVRVIGVDYAGKSTESL